MRNKNILTCFDIANYFIWLANTTGSYISNLKLQKLVYYAQAWYLVNFDTPLFEEDFQAWIHGPVIPELYQQYKGFQWKPIIERIEKITVPDDIFDFLEEVADVYFSCDAYELEKMTHLEDPWIEARGSLSPDIPSNEIITKDSMKRYYSARVQEEAVA